MKNIVWLASYPKSGNTWLRAILSLAVYNYLDINNLGVYSLNNIIKNLYPNHDRIEPGDVKNYWDITQKTISDNAGSSNVIIKTHNVLGNIGGINFPNKNFTSKIIYIVRDPRDISISYSKHFGIDLDIAVERILSETNFIFDNKNNTGEVISSWQNHINSWINSDIPKMIIKFEDLLLDPKSIIIKLFHFLKIKPNISVDEIIKKTSFKSLQNKEKKVGFAEASDKTSLFFRNGKKDQWTKYDKKKFKRLTINLKHTMKSFHYI